MHLRRLEVRNFRAIASASLLDLPANVVIAGPNGCGKSTLFDAIRLWKSAYAGYAENEFQQWFGEFQIDLNNAKPEQLQSLFRDKAQPIIIAAQVTLADEEREYLKENARALLAPQVWRQLAPSVNRGGRPILPSAAAGLTPAEKKFNEQLDQDLAAFLKDLDQPLFGGEFTITPDLQLTESPSPTLELIYSQYLPDFLGVFDYHNAQRSYNREQIANVDLRLEVAEQQQGQQALYNTAAKYQNVKTQMAANYIRDLIAKEAGVPPDARPSIVQSLRELFALFFPDKEFLGPQPTEAGRLTFNVKTASGSQHDLNDLSSGEKEVLYGYLRLRNISPRHSVLLLDEPELHLNPKLLKGLPQFYSRHLGQALSNQIWLLTHSDVLLTEALDQDQFAVFHMQQASDPPKPQLTSIGRRETLERAILSLVGEKASFDPFAPLVIFEGGGDADFDLAMTFDLFPRMRLKVNGVSGTSKSRVRDLHSLIEKALAAQQLNFPVFSIVDQDSDRLAPPPGSRQLIWGVYHIENYLLESTFVHAALAEALRSDYKHKTEGATAAALHAAAKEVSDLVVRSQLASWADRQLYSLLKTGSDPDLRKTAETLATSVRQSVEAIQELSQSNLALPGIERELGRLRRQVDADLKTDKWRSTLPGRDILRRFVGDNGEGIAYEVLRNLIIARMKAVSFEPPGMKEVVDSILASMASTGTGVA